MVTDNGESARYERERAFHDDRYLHDADRARAEKFYESGDASGHRYRELLDTIPSEARVLEYGCGTGSAAFDLASRGVEVLGIDISTVAIKAAEAEAEQRGLTTRASFQEMNAEHLDVPPASFDVVCGSGVLHHLDLDRAFAEVARVLRPQGWAVFVEPLGHNPMINAYRRRTPEMRTPDEHPLRVQDLARARRRFAQVEVDYFNLLTIATVPLRRFGFQSALQDRLHRVDQWLFGRFPAAARHAWVAVIQLKS